MNVTAYFKISGKYLRVFFQRTIKVGYPYYQNHDKKQIGILATIRHIMCHHVYFRPVETLSARLPGNVLNYPSIIDFKWSSYEVTKLLSFSQASGFLNFEKYSCLILLNKISVTSLFNAGAVIIHHKIRNSKSVKIHDMYKEIIIRQSVLDLHLPAYHDHQQQVK